MSLNTLRGNYILRRVRRHQAVRVSGAETPHTEDNWSCGCSKCAPIETEEDRLCYTEFHHSHFLWMKLRDLHTTLAGWSVARPKSPIFTWSCESRKMLTGFKSLWIIPWWKRNGKRWAWSWNPGVWLGQVPVADDLYLLVDVSKAI